jgi:predicted phosphodiesterase
LKIAVLSDIHSAADHFRDALSAAREEGFDRLVILGDLFTYGPDPVETLALVEDALSNDGAILIKGNHDLLYMHGPQRDGYLSSLPDWIAESVAWTAAQLGGSGIDDLPWYDDWTDQRLLLSHANPFGPGDWTYVRDEQSAAAAATALEARNFDWGVFGHVHRFRLYPAPNGGGVATVGSIGQPRDKAEAFGQWAMVTSGPQFSIEQRRIDRGWGSTADKIRNTSMSEPTRERLCQFYQ